MTEKIEGFVIDIVRHNDRHNVVSLYTRTRGRMAFLVPVGKTRQGKARNAVITHMACLGADINIRGGKELYHLGTPTPVRLWHGIYFHPVKSSVLYFLTDFLNRLLRQSPPDTQLWDFIYTSLEALDSLPATRIANFHIAFLTRLLPFVGISPSVGREDIVINRGGATIMLFDMLSGRMVDPEKPTGLQRRLLLTPRESAFIPYLTRINYTNMHHFLLSGTERREILDGLLRYYSLHLSLPTTLPSLEVLHDLFA